MDLSSKYDAIIVGGGPTGLSAAIFIKNLGKSVIILEKGPILGAELRGETLHLDPILDEILGEGVMDKITLSKTKNREFFPPLPSKETMIEVIRRTPSIVFDWIQWIGLFTEKIQELKIPFILNAEVCDTIFNEHTVVGVKFKHSEGSIQEVFGNTVFACDGHSSVISRKYCKKKPIVNFPIIKCLMKNGNYSSKAFKYFLVPTGALDFAPKFPPFIIFLFPRNEKNLETGIIIQTDNAYELGVPIPPVKEIMGIWVKIKSEYPVFSEMIKRASILHEEITAIPMTGPISEFSPRPGLVILGDAAGFVETSGGSGLISSIKMAQYWTNSIFSDEPHSEIKNKFKKTELYKHIIKVAKRYNAFRRFVFVKLMSVDRICRFWWLLSFILKHA
ncbi:MAG: NAD(P)/FAD-dependent oxidoreductase [Candidatus Lokiarchaeota archaeon]|nr:NAD(P)/FAD-dependent oxidoreductase [Candidatus Lokiarchaeota archaeon]